MSNKILLPLLHVSKSIVLAAHSYGVIVGSAAAAGLYVTERWAQGQIKGIPGPLSFFFIVLPVIHKFSFNV